MKENNKYYLKHNFHWRRAYCGIFLTGAISIIFYLYAFLTNQIPQDIGPVIYLAPLLLVTPKFIWDSLQNKKAFSEHHLSLMGNSIEMHFGHKTLLVDMSDIDKLISKKRMLPFSDNSSLLLKNGVIIDLTDYMNKKELLDELRKMLSPRKQSPS